MVAAIRYDSKVWAVGVTTSWAREPNARESNESGRSAETWRDHKAQQIPYVGTSTAEWRRAASKQREYVKVWEAKGVEVAELDT